MENAMHKSFQHRVESLDRREMMRLAALTSLVFGTELTSSLASESTPKRKYTLSVNIEIMFPRDMPRDERIKRVADNGMKAFSFWTVSNEEERLMLAAQNQTGLACGSIA